MIVKVQRSLRTTHRNERVLIYNEDRTVMWEGDLPGPIRRALGEDFRAFFEAHIERTLIVLDHRVEEQGW